MQKLVTAGKGGWGGGMGEVVTSRAFFSFSNKATAHPENVGLTLNAPKDVFPCQLVSYGVIYSQGISFPRFYPKNPNFGDMNRHFKPNLQKIKIPISSKGCIGLT